MQIDRAEQVYLNALTFLIDGGEDEEASLLLSTNPSEIIDFTDANDDFVLIARRSTFDILKDVNDKRTANIQNALNAVYRRERHGIDLQVMYGLVDSKISERFKALIEEQQFIVPTVNSDSFIISSKTLIKPISIFSTNGIEKDEKLGFVLMPFAPNFQTVYEKGIKPGIAARNLICRRADDITKPGDILNQIWTSLLQAKVVIADLSGANGNVLYELGLAHVIGHQVILITQNMANIPFDLRQQRHIIYNSSEQGLRKLSTEIAISIQNLIISIKNETLDF